MNLTEIQKLIKLLRETPELGSIEVRGWFGRGIVVSRNGSGGGPSPGTRLAAPAAEWAPDGSGILEARPVEKLAAPAAALKEIKSPMVGTFYTAPEPGAGPYVKPGSRIAPGQTICIIEAMKIMNEIEAEVAGVVREVCVEDATPVEFGQVLFRVDPNG